MKTRSIFSLQRFGQLYRLLLEGQPRLGAWVMGLGVLLVWYSAISTPPSREGGNTLLFILFPLTMLLQAGFLVYSLQRKKLNLFSPAVPGTVAEKYLVLLSYCLVVIPFSLYLFSFPVVAIYDSISLVFHASSSYRVQEIATGGLLLGIVLTNLMLVSTFIDPRYGQWLLFLPLLGGLVLIHRYLMADPQFGEMVVNTFRFWLVAIPNLFLLIALYYFVKEHKSV